jgi:hypothetical protein
MKHVHNGALLKWRLQEFGNLQWSSSIKQQPLVVTPAAVV